MSNESIKAWEYHIDTSFIDNLYPVNKLSQRSRARIIKKAKFENIQRNKEIHIGEKDVWIIFLLQGGITINGGTPENSNEDDDKSLAENFTFPLFNGIKGATCVFNTQSRIVRFDKRLYELLLEEDYSTTSENSDIDMSEIESQVFFHILNANQQGYLELKGSDFSANRVQALINHGTIDPESLLTLASSDPVFAGKLIRESNSGPFIGMPHAQDLEQSLARLDETQVKNLAKSHADSSQREEVNSLTSNLTREIHSHSIRIVTWCEILAKKSKKLSPDKAFLSGLLHEGGNLLILQVTSELGITPDQRNILEESLDKMQPLVSSMVMSRWGLGGDFIKAAEKGHNFEHFSTQDVDYCDMVIAAHWCEDACNNNSSTLPARRNIAAFRKLGLEYLSNKDIIKANQYVNEQYQIITEFSSVSQAS